MTERGGSPEGGLLSSVASLARTLIALLQTRLELLSTEFEEERLRIEQMLLYAVAAGFCLGVAALLAVTFVVVLFWDTHRLAAIGGLCAIFLAAGTALAAALRAASRARPRLFSATLEELAKDRNRIGPSQ